MIPPLAFKIAVQLIEKQLTPQTAEPADIPAPAPASPATTPPRSILALLGKQTATATEPAPKVVTDTGKLNL